MAYQLSRLCEEFHRLPSEILAETMRLPDGLLFEVLEARAYAATKHGYDASEAHRQGIERPNPLLDLVKAIEAELVAGDIEEGA